MTRSLEAAARIGRSLRDSAHWDRGGRLCNWMGRSPAEADRVDGPITPTSAALGADLYGGSAGVALFLAELFEKTGDASLRRTSRGALARSVHRLGSGSEPGDAGPLSFFNGHLGVAYVAQRVAVLTGDDEASRAAHDLFGRAIGETAAPRSLDVIGGNAGAIPALLDLGHALGRPEGLTLAVTLGEELLNSGIEPDVPAGIAHGAAGFGLALWELQAVTGRADFRDAALLAFDHSNSLADGYTTSHAPHPGSRHRALAWCHGATGVALARFRASTVAPLGRDAHLAAAHVALDAMIRDLDATDLGSRPDASLCHGLSGALEALIVADSPLADTLAESLITRHADSGDWPSGLPSGGPNPSLMLGNAGIGHALLRHHSPRTVPSILVLNPSPSSRSPLGFASR